MKILFVNANLKGHVHPTLEMAEVLVKRGHEVSFFSGEEFRVEAEEIGAKFEVFPESLVKFFAEYRPSDRHPFFLLTEYIFSWDEAMLPVILTLCRRENFDLLVCDSVFGGAFFLKQILNIPIVVSHSTFASKRTPLPERMLQPGFHPQLDRSNAISKRIAESYGIKPATQEEIFVSRGDLNLVYTSRKFGGFPAPEDGSDDAYLFVGPSLRRRSAEPVFEAPEDGRPIVLVSMGSIGISDPGFFRACIEALRGTEFRGILSVGAKIPLESLGELAENITAAAYVSQLEILPQAAVFVTHAGFNSTHEAILFGVPMLAVPFANDQFLVAKRIVENGLGETAELTSITPEKLRDAITRLAGSAEIRARCREAAENMCLGPTREDAAGRIEELV